MILWNKNKYKTYKTKMTNKMYAIVLFALFFLWINPAFGENYNAGFIPGQIWFSKNPFFEGDKIKIYTAIYNYSEIDIHGFVEFTDNGNLLKNVEFSMSRGSAVRDLWIDYAATGGDHDFKVNIIEAKKALNEDNLVPIILDQNNSANTKKFIDGDNDQDGVGNREDTDDDNDGITDLDEIKNGTNPFAADKISSSTKETQIATTSDQITRLRTEIENNTSDMLKKYLPGSVSAPIDVINNYLDGKSMDLEKAKQDIKNNLNPGLAVEYLIEKNKIINQDGTTTENIYRDSLLGANNETNKIKDNILNNIKRIPSWAYYYILTVTVYILSHKIVLIILLFLLIFLLIRKIIKLIVK